jgi:hypothetical protein
MNEFHDPLEAELASFRPHEPSPALKQHIADELSSRRPVVTFAPESRTRHRTAFRLALTAALVAACVLVAVWLPKSGPRQPLEPVTGQLQPATAMAFDETLPSVWTYHSALTRRPDSLDALFDKHSTLIREPKPQRAGAFVSVFTPSDPELDELLGEL